ncbi:MAG: hypothetical protein E7665_01355 [Ruminococcaceae bacterium]|nr:hypothetical protein [Oscillospiraceae bacterium]
MSNFLYGFFLIIFNYSISIGSIKIGVIPDFAGYLFILNGIDQMKEYSDKFAKARTLAKIMFIYSILLYISDLLALSSIFASLWLIPSMISVVLSYIIIFTIISGFKDMEVKYECVLGSKKLFINAAALIAIKVVFTVLTVITLNGFVYMGSLVAHIIVGGVFVFFIADARSRFFSYFTEE